MSASKLVKIIFITSFFIVGWSFSGWPSAFNFAPQIALASGAQTLYFRSTASTVVSSNTSVDQLSTTAGTSNNTGTSIKHAKNANTWQFIPNTANNTTTYAIPGTPNSKGWIFDGSVPGDYAGAPWTIYVDVKDNYAAGTAVIKAQVWKVTATTSAVTQVTNLSGIISSASFTPSTSESRETLTFTPAAFSLTAGQYIYVEVYLTMTAGSSSTSAAMTDILDSSSGTLQGEIVTSSFTPVLPDFSVSTGDISFNPTSPNPGQSVTGTAVIHNIGAAGYTDSVGTTDYAAQSNGAAAATADSYQSTYLPANANDNKVSTAWASSHQSGWVQIDMQTARDIIKVGWDDTFFATANWPTSFTIYLSSDNVNWISVASSSSYTTGTYTSTLAHSVNARYIKMTMTASPGSAATLDELYAYDTVGIDVKFYNGDPATTGTQIGTTQTLDSLAASATGQVSTAWIAGAAGAYNIYVTVNTPATITESDSTNNKAFQTLNVVPPPTLNHYRWRDDSTALNTSGGFLADQDTGYSSLVNSTTIRLRVEVANAGVSSTSTYKLQYAPLSGTCAASVYKDVPVSATNDPWQMVTTPNYLDGAAVTSSFLTPTGTFTNGLAVANPSNITASATIPASGYTEFEYAIQPTNYATDSGTYCFKLVAAGIPAFTNSVYPTVTMAAPPILVLNHYRWRDDSTALNTSGGFLADQDAVYTSISTTPVFRLRIEIANSSVSNPASNYQYKLEYARKIGSSCSTGSFAAVPTAAGSALQMIGSTQYLNNASASSSLLTATGTWVSGYGISSSSNTTPSYTVGGNSYTEIEYAIKATGASAGGPYCFRITNNGNNANFTYSVYPELDISWYANWSYYRPVNIANNVASVLTNYETKLTLNTQALITASQLQSKCQDLRFVGSDGMTRLGYFFEPVDCNSATTPVWVNIPSIPASGTTTIYMYYGNASAASESSGDETFAFFDDFESGTINPAKWIIDGTDGNLPYADTSTKKYGSYALHSPTYNTNNNTYTMSANVPSSLATAGVFEAYALYGETNRYHYAFNYKLNIPDGYGYTTVAAVTNWAYYTTARGFVNYSPVTAYSANTWYLVSEKYNFADKTANVNGTYYPLINGSTAFGAQALLNYNGLGGTAMAQWGGIFEDSGGGAWWLDDVRMRSYALTEPTGTVLSVPTVTTPTSASITNTTATLGATVTSDGGSALTARGICWGTSPAPTACSPEGQTGVSAFTMQVTGLSPDTTYYYRGYATNSSGIAYSPDATFTTASSSQTPTVTAINPTSGVNTGSVSITSITGTNFVSGATVKLTMSGQTDISCSGFTVTNSTTLSNGSCPISGAVAGTWDVVVTDANGTGTLANGFTVNNPVPTTSSISPTSKSVGDTGFNLTVNGTNFVSTSVVKFNGSDRTTTYISATQLTASILTSDLTTVGTFPITVFNPTPGGGTSGSKTFTVNAVIPTVTTPTSASVNYTTATLGATVTSDGGSALTARGICWDITPAPTAHCNPAGGTDVGVPFTMPVTGLPVGTKIYFRGYATNSVGTGYSTDGSFTTLGNKPTGNLISIVYNTGVTAPAYNSIMWKGTLPLGTRVRFQLATSPNSGGPWNFIGSDGTSCGSGYWYEAASPNTPISLGCASILNGKQYFKYQVQLCSSIDCMTSGEATPTITSIVVNWSP
jgi:hypothetical protein